MHRDIICAVRLVSVYTDFRYCTHGNKFLDRSAPYITHVIEREFGAYKSVRDSSPKYVLSLDDMDMSKDGIIHLNIEEWLLHKKDLYLS